MAAASGGQPFSMHSRGVQTFESSRILDISLQSQNAMRELRDISSSMLYFLYLQSWQAVFVTVITIGSVSFFTYVHQQGQADALSWTLVAFVVLLPSLLLLYLGFQRRELAHQQLAIVKVTMLQLCWSSEESHELILALLSLMRLYLNATRFYAVHYPFAGITSKMTVIAQTRAKQMRQATLIFRDLSRQAAAGLVMQLQQAFERLAIVKEYRLPQGLRTLVRLYVVLVIPIFYGPYYAQISNNTHTFVFVLFFAVMMHLGMVALMNAAILLEDPFATEGVDGVFCDEVFFEIEQAILQGSGPTSKPQFATPPPVNSLADHGRPDQTAIDMAAVASLPVNGSLEM